MKISVLVPTLGTREKEIRRLLETLEKQSYKDFEIIFVTQDNHEIVKDIICKYSNLDIKQIEMSVKGLSRARNRGLEQASGEIVVLSDDDCWYPVNAFEIIVNAFEKRQCAKIVLSQIFDPEKNIPYKNYTSNEEYVRNKLQLMSKSSIEVAFKKDLVMNKKFDERLGLGSEFVCGEEVDFLLSNYEKNTIFYIPEATVYHKKKENGSSNKQIIAKGAIYGKNFNIFICLLVLLRDLMLKKKIILNIFLRDIMNILKEQIKLSVAYPGWRLAIKKLKSNKNKKIFLFGTPMHGNLGDHAIAIQEQYFFEDFFPDYEYFEILMPMYHIQKK